jgi:ATP-dependent DNA ligase
MIEPFLPMLAGKAEPFDSPEYLFELKWDGIRALAAGGQGGAWQLWGRDLADYRPRYPELGGLARLPAGTALDGEIVLPARGLPDLDALLARHGLTAARTIAARSRQEPVTYQVFDAPWDRGRCLFGRPLAERRAVARARVAALGDARVAFPEGIVEGGRAFFKEAVARGHEGIMAKHLAGRYQPGRRAAAWKKIKPSGCVPAVVFGYLPGRAGVRALLVAVLRDGRLRYAARLNSGLDGALRRHLAGLLAPLVRPGPAVVCAEHAVWVEPRLYCRVGFLGWTPGGRLRGARFGGLLGSAAPAAGP